MQWCVLWLSVICSNDEDFISCQSHPSVFDACDTQTHFARAAPYTLYVNNPQQSRSYTEPGTTEYWLLGVVPILRSNVICVSYGWREKREAIGTRPYDKARATGAVAHASPVVDVLESCVPYRRRHRVANRVRVIDYSNNPPTVPHGDRRTAQTLGNITLCVKRYVHTHAMYGKRRSGIGAPLHQEDIIGGLFSFCFYYFFCFSVFHFVLPPSSIVINGIANMK